MTPSRSLARSLVALTFIATVPTPQPSPGYHVVTTFPVGGDGGWDYVALDTIGHRIFVTRGDRLSVLDPETGKSLGEITGLNRAHGTAFAYEFGHGFVTSGRDSTVTMFDLKSLQVLAKTKVALDADGILYDPATKRIFSMNGDSKSASAVDPSSGALIGTVDLGSGPEFGVSAGDGKLYINLEESSEVAEVDARALKVTRRWSLAPCQSPSGLAIDRAHHRLFSGCHNKVMAISDAVAGKVLTTVPIDGGVDANVFDPGTGYAFSSNGEGTLTVAHDDGHGGWAVVQTVQTMPSARTMALDPKTHKIYLVGAKFGPAPTEATPDNPRKRPPVLPGSFTLLVVGT